GRGSTFSFEIPLKAAKAEEESSAAREEKAVPLWNGHPYRILIVDDESTNRLIAMRMLQQLGVDPAWAESGEEALNQIRTDAFDLVFMDCSMPGMDGFEATAAIRQLPGPASRTPIVALTAHAMRGDRERCLAAGMDEYVAKPFGKRDFERILQLLPTLRRSLAA
ncbi:MAG: response regulator, partial [Planctomycetota bacterium]